MSKIMDNYLEVSISTLGNEFSATKCGYTGRGKAGVDCKNQKKETVKRKRSKIPDPSNWRRNKMRREKIENKQPKSVDCSKCKFSCTYKIEEEHRKIICKKYWNCNFNHRKDFILNNVESHIPKRRRQRSDSKRQTRVDSKVYFLASKSNLKVRVCKNFFINTLCISKDVVDHAFRHKGDSGLFIGEDKRGRKAPHNKTRPEDIIKVKNHIEYCFPDTLSQCLEENRDYQLPDFKLSMTNMYNLYKVNCDEEGCKPVSTITYRRILYNTLSNKTGNNLSANNVLQKVLYPEFRGPNVNALEEESHSSTEFNSDAETISHNMEKFLEVSLSTVGDECSATNCEYTEPVAEKIDDKSIKKGIATKRKRSKISDPSNWQRHKMRCEKIENKQPKSVDCSKCKFKCSVKIEPEYRKIICRKFWDFDFINRKDFILNHVESHVPKRRRQSSESRRQARIDSKVYFLVSESGNKVRVCKLFFTNTLCISKDVVDHAFRHKGDEGLFEGEDKRGKKVPPNKTRPEDVAKVKKHIKGFQDISKCTTDDSNKYHLLDNKTSITNMYNNYKKMCEREKCKPISRITYRRIFYNSL